MYDIEFVIPVTTQQQYKQRIVDLKEVGLINVEDKKVLLTLLIGPEHPSEIEKGWAANIDVNVVSGIHRQETAKTYAYFSSFSKDFIERSRWIAKIDDDTVTDVSTLVDKLDEEFDYQRDYYVVTELRPEQHRYEDDILKRLGFVRWFVPKCVLWHELEGCVISQSTLAKIVNEPKAMELMKLRSEIPEGYNDYCLACAARICKIYPTDAYFLSRHPLIGDFSLFGGQLAHIHDLANDKNEHALDLFKRMLAKDMGGGSDLYPEVVDKEFVYLTQNGANVIRLKESGIIQGGGDCKVWHIKPGGNLEFLKNDGTLVAVFDNYENSNDLQGYFVSNFQKEAKPILRKLAT